MANAFMLAGVKHYIGTFWEILDEPSSRFAVECYRQALSGKTVGEAVREARLALIRQYGEEAIVWASYLLYGDPTFNYLDQIREKKPAPVVESASERLPQPGKAVRPPEDIGDAIRKEVKKKGKVLWAAAAGFILILGILLWGYPGFLREGTQRYETLAIGAALSESFGNTVPASIMTEKISGSLSAKINALYPIRGKIMEIKGNEIRLDIGQTQGVTIGQKFKGMESLGILEIISARPEESSAKILKKEKDFFQGERVEAM